MVSQDNTQDHSFPSYHVLTVLNRKQRPLQTTGADLDEWNSEEWCGGEVTFWKIGPSKKFVNRKRKVKSEKQILTSTRPSNASKYDRTWLRGHKSETISLLWPRSQDYEGNILDGNMLTPLGNINSLAFNIRLTVSVKYKSYLPLLNSWCMHVA